MANAGDIGVTIRIDAGFDLSSNTSLQIELRKPDGSLILGTATVGAVDLTVTDDSIEGCGETETFLTDEYAEYVSQTDDLSLPGRYKSRILYQDITRTLSSDRRTFKVDS